MTKVLPTQRGSLFFLFLLALFFIAPDLPAQDPVGEPSYTITMRKLACPARCDYLYRECRKHCGPYGDVNAALENCDQACERIFKETNGFCKTKCENADFLMPCRPDHADYDAKNVDDCQWDNCEARLAECTIAFCREHAKDKTECYELCNTVFYYETSQCKIGCLTEAQYMESCAE